MIKADGKFTMNAEGVRTKLAGNTRRAQLMLDQQVAKDSNYYCPEDEGGLHKSVLPSAATGRGLLEWNEEYARPQYYGLPNKSLDENPNARMKWFEAAKAVCKKKWLGVARRGFAQ